MARRFLRLAPDHLPYHVECTAQTWRRLLAEQLTLTEEHRKGFWVQPSHCSAAQIGALSRLVWPSLVVVRGCTLLEDNFSQLSFESFWTSREGDVPSIERVMNHVHLYDVFGDVDLATLEGLLTALQNTWTCRLEQIRPGAFRVFTAGEPEEYGPTITFCTVEAEQNDD